MKKIKRFFKKTVSGLIAGGADNDPAGISTYSMAGAQFGYSLNWLMILAAPMLIAVQAMCARLGDVKRKGLTKIIKEHYHPLIAFLSTLILILCNIITIGADLAGVSAAMGLVTRTNYLLWILPFSLLILYVVIFKNYKTIEKFLLGLVFVFISYIFAGILAKPDWGIVLKETIFPKIQFVPAYFAAAVGTMGTTITPYLFFWQTKEETEEKESVKQHLFEAKREDLILAPGFIFSQIIALFIMISTATVFFSNGIKDINSAAEAAEALEPFAGPYAQLLFAVGIIGAGLLAIPVLASSTAYVLAETMGWRDSLSDKVHQAKGFYAVLTLSVLLGVILAFINVNPIKALFYSQILSGILGPFLLILILLLCNNKKVMGKFTNSWFDNLFGWLAVVIMLLSTVAFLWQVIK